MKKIVHLLMVGIAISFVPQVSHAGLFDNVKDIILQLDEDNIPTRSSSFKFSNSDWFDAKLHVSLKHNYHHVTIDMTEEYLPGEIPNRMERWLAKSRDKTARDLSGEIRNGKVLVCMNDETGSALFGMLAKHLLKLATRAFVTYKPVKNYDAFVMLDDFGYVDDVKFFHKRSDRVRPNEKAGLKCSNYFDYIENLSDRVE